MINGWTSRGVCAFPQLAKEMRDQFLQGFSPDHRDAQHFLVVGFLLTVVARHHFVGDEGDPEDSEATMSGYNYFWDSAHAYGRRGKDQDESGFTPKQELSKAANQDPTLHPMPLSLSPTAPSLCYGTVKGCDTCKAVIVVVTTLLSTINHPTFDSCALCLSLPKTRQTACSLAKRSTDALCRLGLSLPRLKKLSQRKMALPEAELLSSHTMNLQILTNRFPRDASMTPGVKLEERYG